jgi:hypothetical protein
MAITQRAKWTPTDEQNIQNCKPLKMDKNDIYRSLFQNSAISKDQFLNKLRSMNRNGKFLSLPESNISNASNIIHLNLRFSSFKWNANDGPY